MGQRTSKAVRKFMVLESSSYLWDKGRWQKSYLNISRWHIYKLVTFSFQKVQNCFSNHINALTSDCSLVSFPFIHVTLAVGDARRCPESSRLCTGVWYKEKKNEGKKGREWKGMGGDSMAEALGHCSEWASEGLDPDIATELNKNPSDSHYEGPNYNHELYLGGRATFWRETRMVEYGFEGQVAGSQGYPLRKASSLQGEKEKMSIHLL